MRRADSPLFRCVTLLVLLVWLAAMVGPYVVMYLNVVIPRGWCGSVCDSVACVNVIDAAMCYFVDASTLPWL